MAFRSEFGAAQYSCSSKCWLAAGQLTPFDTMLKAARNACQAKHVDFDALST